jgi:hypothetical protein
MRSSTIRPQRGRPAKVTKPSSSSSATANRRTSRHSSVARDAEQQLEAALAHHDDDAPEENDADADAEIAQDDDDHPGSLDPATAAGILTNGPAYGAQDPALHPGWGAPHSQFAMEAPMDTASVKTAEELSRDSGYPDLKIDSALAKRLAKEPGIRLAVQRREEQALNLNRRSNVEALLAHVSGQRTASPCKNCHKGHGPWNDCVVVDGQMCGSCANCWFNASGSRCSFHGELAPSCPEAACVKPCA